ncbi:flagellar hook-associated protein FlgK [Alkalihalobacillus sp. AL-G]|uniref:flagellar hook-associated protein FlgK n=1 Tax=Alkalihalobacillus sp. AL-G TaxID=2926399 RepID=UPI00272BB545|nr:flagellar hook-associated protein FlgK [Alkalihalobacillus sp. AL-G]WLD92975.1 flagellar hook-associated protein FlgK [Alkalihalobacillus sp. AL-G]
MSTFHGLETAVRGLRTHQSALRTTGHNIANANTPGYSRQRVNFSQTGAFPAPGRNRPEIPGQIGTGVEAGTIQRIREGFLDIQFRGETTKSGYWTARSEALHKMEEIMNEPSDFGLAKTMDRFWQSLQDLAANPEGSARSVVRQRGIALADTFGYLSTSLSSVKNDLENQTMITVKTINSIASQINDINKQISEIEPHGYLPNDLYDQRDLLVDKLSEYVNVKVTPVANGGHSLQVAEGKYTIDIVDDAGNSIGTLVDGANLTADTISIKDTDADGAFDQYAIGASAGNIGNFASGKLKGLIESYGYEDTSGKKTGDYIEMLASLDEMAYRFAKAFNDQHQQGTDLNGNAGGNFFSFTSPVSGTDFAGAASMMKLDSAITGPNGLDKIAASGDGFAGDGSNALALADVKDQSLTFTSGDTSVQLFYEGVIGEMAVDAQQSNRLMDNASTLKQSVEARRQSVSGVSLDEEMAKMVQFQHAYNAAARNITTIDEMLDRIINGMGRVGR